MVPARKKPGTPTKEMVSVRKHPHARPDLQVMFPCDKMDTKQIAPYPQKNIFYTVSIGTG